MKNYLLVNRALAAEKKINLIEMLQGCSKRNGTTFRQSNPDGQPTVNRQSRLMLRQGWFRNLAMIFAVLVMSIANIGMAWGETTLFDVNFVDETTETISTSNSSATFVSKTYDGYNMSFGVKSSKNIDITNKTGLVFSGNNAANYNCIAIPLTLTKDNKVTVTITLKSNGKVQYVWKSGALPATPPSLSFSNAIEGTTNTIEYTPTSAGSYVLYLGRSGASSGKEVKSIVITQAGGGSSYSITYHCNDATSGCPATNPATEQTALPNPLPSVTKTNYTFGGWYTDAAYSSAASAGATLSVNADLYAKWTQTITLDREGATTGSTSVTATYNSATLPSITNPTKDGFVFEGWYDGDNGTGNLVINTSGALQANVSGYTGAGGIWTSTTARTLYAKWTEKAADPWIIKVALSGSSGATKTMSGSIGGTSTASGLGSSSPYKIAENEAYVSLTLASGYFQAGDSVVLDLSKQGQIFWGASNNDNDHLLGLTTSKSSIHYFILPNTFPANTNTIHVGRTSSTYNGTLTYMAVYRPEKTCTAPSSVSVSGTWDRFAGETITLTADVTGGSGSALTYQWQKYYNSQWNNIAGATSATYTKNSCTTDDSGTYQCIATYDGSCSTASNSYTVYVYTLECYTGGTTVHHFTRTEDSQAGTLTMDLAANTAYQFKVHADTKYYGNNGTVNSDVVNWVLCNNSTEDCTKNLTVNSGLGGTFTFTMEYSTGGNSSVEGEPEISVTYPRKRIYLSPGVWDAGDAKFAYNYWRDGVTAQWTDFLTNSDCGMYADIPQWNGVKIIAVRLKNTTVTPGSWDDKWNQTSDLTVTSNDLITITGWDNSETYNSTYTIPTYTIGYAKGSVPTGGGSISGSKSNETKTCGVDFTLPSSAVFTTTGYTQTGWTTSDGGAQTHALGGSYTDNAVQTFYPVWTVNNYDLTWNLAGGTTTSAGTGIASDVSSNTTTSQAFGTALTAPTVTKTGYNFSAWSPAVASTMPAANTTYTAQWTAKTTAITLDKNGGDTDGSVSATYGSKDVSSLVHATRTGYTQDGYETSDHTLILKSDGTFDGTHSGYTDSKTWVNENAAVTLYARWTANKYDITYKDEGNVAYSGSNSGALPAKHTYGSATVLVDGVKEGYTFGGWYTSSDCSTGLVTSLGATAYTADITLYAKWTAAAEDPIITYNIKVTGSGTTITGDAATTTDGTNLTSISIDETHAGASGDPTGSNRSTKIAIKTGANGADWSGTPDNYVLFKYNVACGKKLTPSKISIPVANVGSASANNIKYKAVMSDEYDHSLSGTYVVTTQDGTVESFDINNADASKYFQGEVTLKLWAWTIANKSNGGSNFRLGTPVKIFGEVANQATPAATITWNTQPANGQVGDPDFAYDVTCSDGSAVTVTSANTTYATIVGGKLHYAAAGTTHLVATATDACGNVVVQNSDNFTVSAAAPAEDCITITNFATTNSSNTLNVYKGTISDANKYLGKTTSSSTVGKNSGADLLLKYKSSITIYNAPAAETNFTNITEIHFDVKANDNTKRSGFEVYVGATKVATISGGDGGSTVFNKDSYTTLDVTGLEQLTGYVRITSTSSSGAAGYDTYIDNIEICTSSLDACTTPALPDLSNKTVCEGGDADAAWDATITNSLATGESVAYSWTKKGNSTVLSSVATYRPTSVTEAMAGTYVVTATVSADSKASSSASKEVTLTVNEATEVTAITADKATVYPTNSVTLTATASADATWQWYTCSNAEGASESRIDDATSASYTIASAGSAGTYYYKVKATGDCGMDEMVYTLTVSAAAGGDCFHYVSVLPDKDISPSSGANIVTPTHATTLEGGTMKVGSQQITITKNGLKLEGSKSVSITLESALEAGNVVIVKGTTATAGYGVTINGVNFYESGSKTFDVSYTVAAGDGLVGKTALTVTKYNGSSYLQEIKITGCGESCTDPEVTASVNNTTACAESSVTFTATGAHAEATYQWQKYSGGAWTDISGATNATYTIASVATTDAMKYRVIASHVCDRTSNEVTLSVPVAPVFGSFSATRSVMATQALSITDVEASDATSYAWYKSADATYDAGSDTRVGTAQELLLAAGGEAAGDTYYLFCVASNSCGSTTSSAITVNVTALVEEDCATRGNEVDAEFGFQNSGCGQGTYNSASCWTMNSNSKILIYSAPDGKYFKTMKVTIASSSASKASYNWSTNGGTTYTSEGVAITGITTTLTEKTIDLSTHGNVNEVKIGRNFGKGESGGTLYVSKICFEYTDACTATTVTPSVPSKTHTIGESFSAPTFTLGPAAVSGGTLTYSSSDEEIASVDESGNVTFNGTAGTVTITASYAGATIAGVDYCASEGSYTITVSCEGGAPKIVAAGSVNMSGCNSSVTLNAKTQAGADFADGTYQWFRNGEEIDGATSKSYTAKQAGTYTVARTKDGCTSPSSNSAVVTSTATEPEVERLVPFQYYHVDKDDYSDQMKMRHLFAVKNSGKLDGKSFKMYVSRSGGAASDVTSSNALVVWPNGDGHVDTVMVDLNKLSGKYSVNDELVFTCKAIDCDGNVSDVYKNTITMNVIGATPTLALICSGSSKAGGTRKESELTVGGDFLTGYNKADLCEQTGKESFDANTEWGLYTRLKENYIVTPVNGYAVFNKLNYEPFDILLLTDYPKASKSDAAATVLDDMAALCDYRPMLSFKTHMVKKSPSKWAKKGFTTSPVVTKADGRLNLNIVCYAHPMFASLKTGDDVYTDVGNTSAPLVYTMLSGTGYEGSKGMQGFELAAAENFITIGLTHYNATITKNSPRAGEVTWTPGSEDRMLVTVAERQANPAARFILFSLNIGAHSKLTEKGEDVVLACLNYLLGTAEGTIEPADCSFTFDNGENNKHDASWYASNCPSCTGTSGDGKWTTAANWGPDYRLLPGEFNSVRIKKPVEVNDEHAHVMEVRIIDEGSIDIPAGKALDVKSTIRRMDGSEIYPTEENDIHVGSASTGNGTLIFNNDEGDTKAQVDMYSNAKADVANMSAATSTWQYIGTPHNDVASATRNYYDSWLYQYLGSGWEVIPNGGPLVPFRGYCVTHPAAPVVFDMVGTLVATTAQSIAVPAGYTVIANSWTAPIDISTFTDDDMENISDKTIYFFNTGTDADGDHGTGTEAGTYVAVPKNSASYVGTWQIPSMQGFYISTTSAGTLHLDYDRHVRPHSVRDVVSNPMYAPRRAKAEGNEPNVLKIFARGSRYQDKLVVLEREDFTRGYDSGWDGEAWGGGTLSPMVYVTGEGREDAVSAIPEFEGTVIAFKAGEDNEYTIDFEYNSEEPLYLLDTENNTYTQIMTGNAYYFTTSDKSKHARFILTRKSPQIATGVGNVSGDEVQGTKAKKLLIEDKMFIMVNGVLYDATGKVVK